MFTIVNRIAAAAQTGFVAARTELFTSVRPASIKAALKTLTGYQAKLANLVTLAVVEEQMQAAGHLLDEVECEIANLRKFGCFLPGIGAQVEAELGYPSLGFRIADLEFKIVASYEAHRDAVQEEMKAAKAAVKEAKAAEKAAAGKHRAGGKHRVTV